MAIFGTASVELTSATFSGDGWGDDKVDLLYELWNQDFEIDEIASELEVSLFRIATQAIKLDLVEIDDAFLNAVQSFYE
jgi:hypothetical protein